MKNKFTLLAAGMLLTVISSAQMTFEGKYTASKFTYAECALELKEEASYVVGGKISSTSTDENFLLFALESNGNLKWEKVLGDPSYDETVIDMIAAPDGGFIALGSRAISPAYPEVVLIKMKNDGTLDWMRVYPPKYSTISTFPRKIIEVNGKYVIMSAGADLNSKNSIDMMQTDLTGNFITSRRIISDRNIDPMDLLHNANTNELIVLGTETMQDTTPGILMSLDTQFNLIAYKKWLAPGLYGDHFSSFCQSVTSPVEYVAWGDFQNSLLKNNSTFANIGDLTHSTHTLMHHTFNGPGFVSNAVNIDRCSSGIKGHDYYALSTGKTSNEKNRPVMQILDDQGAEILVATYAQNINSNNSVTPKAVIETSDLGFLIIGNYYQLNTADIYVVKTDKYLKTSCKSIPLSFKTSQENRDERIDLSLEEIKYDKVPYGQEFPIGIEYKFPCLPEIQKPTGIMLYTTDEKITIYPNVTASSLNILSTDSHKNLTVCIVNMLGTKDVLFEGNTEENMPLNLNVSDVAPGNYILMVQHENKVLKKQIISVTR